MASRSGLYTHCRRSRTYQSEDRIRKINLISFDINFDHHLIIDQGFSIKIFPEEEIDACFDYITSGINDIYLFISNIISNTFIQSICEYPQIKSIYLFSKDHQYENYLDSTRKLRSIFRNFDTMFKQFQDDITELKNQYYSEQTTFQNIDRENGEILWWTFFDKIVQHIQHTNIAKREFLTFFREMFPNNERALREIEEFESNYTSDKAIYWYTRGSFLYKFFNQTLRAKMNFNNIFKLRMFLIDLIVGLRAEHSTFDGCINPIVTYRGLTMKLEEVERLKSIVGDIICFNQFVSATMNKDIAQAFAEAFTDPCFSEHVLFTIEINSLGISSGTTPFANISKISCFLDEDEVLFSMHSIFLVQSIQLVAENFYQIHLKFVDNPWNSIFSGRSLFNPHEDQLFLPNLREKNKQLIGFQLLLDMILRLDQTKYAKDELLEFCRLKYQDNSIRMKEIDEFERSYQSEDAVKWYTKDCFLYRLINQLLQTEPINCLIKMRYYIHDVHNQLDQLQPSFIQSLNGETGLILYRGRTMKINQLNELRNSIGGLISINSFFSATQNKQIAISFSCNGYKLNSDEVTVIYEILINTNILSIPYAKIKNVIKDEEEILFSMGSIFRVQNVRKFHDRMYSIQLIMEHIEDDLWDHLTAHLD